MRRTLTLLGPDVLLHAMGGERPNNAVFVVECRGVLSADRVRRALDQLLPYAPYMSSRLERPLPWGRLRWRVVNGPPPLVQRRMGPRESIESLIDDVLNERVDPRRQASLRFLVVESHDGARSWLVLAWVHPLMDPRGAELLVAMLNAVDRGGEANAWAAKQMVEPPAEPHSPRSHGRLAERARAQIKAVGRYPVTSLGRSATGAGRLRHRRLVVPAVKRQLPLTLALVGHAVAELHRERGLQADQPFLVPISVDRRRKGEPGPVFGNYLSFHFARFTPAAAEDVAATASAIRRDMVEALRADLVEALWLGMSYSRYSPPCQLMRPFRGGGLASFNCADTGEIRPSLTTLLGAHVGGAYHAPCVQPQPGLGIFFSRFGETESIVAVSLDDVVTGAEIDRLLENVESRLAALRSSAIHEN